ncbi:hypothetical protein [Sinomonas atrocyanea]
MSLTGDLSGVVAILLYSVVIGLVVATLGHLGWRPHVREPGTRLPSLSVRRLARALPAFWLVLPAFLLFVWGFGAFSYFSDSAETRSSSAAAVSAATMLLGALILATWMASVAFGLTPRHVQGVESDRPQIRIAEHITVSGRALGIISVILPFVGLGLVGLVLAIIAKSLSKRAGLKNTPASVGMVLGAISVAIGIIAAVAMILGVLDALNQCQHLGEGIHQTGSGTTICR